MKKIIFVICLLSSSAFADSYAVVDQNGNVVNVIEWDGVSNYPPPAGDTLVKDPYIPPRVGIGWTYQNGQFVYGSPPTPPTSPIQGSQ
ncbi:MAG: hypothetical protein KGJ90_07190 [Patescibacteria group bacterium]|nr:hypothetical protein [Patescibacteria group bacterium]